MAAVSCWPTLLFKMFKRILGFSINISWHGCKNRVFWPQLPIVWHQACPIWLILKSDGSWVLFTSRSKQITASRGCELIFRLFLYRSLWFVERSFFLFYNQWKVLFYVVFVKCVVALLCALRADHTTFDTRPDRQSSAGGLWTKWRRRRRDVNAKLLKNFLGGHDAIRAQEKI